MEFWEEPSSGILELLCDFGAWSVCNLEMGEDITCKRQWRSIVQDWYEFDDVQVNPVMPEQDGKAIPKDHNYKVHFKTYLETQFAVHPIIIWSLSDLLDVFVFGIWRLSLKVERAEPYVLFYQRVPSRSAKYDRQTFKTDMRAMQDGWGPVGPNELRGWWWNHVESSLAMAFVASKNRNFTKLSFKVTNRPWPPFDKALLSALKGSSRFKPVYKCTC